MNKLFIFLTLIIIASFFVFSNSLQINTNLYNSLLYIKKIFLTDSGSPSGTTTISLDGASGNIHLSGTIYAKDVVVDLQGYLYICVYSGFVTNIFIGGSNPPSPPDFNCSSGTTFRLKGLEQIYY